MLRNLLAFSLIIAGPLAHAAAPPAASNAPAASSEWRERVAELLPLMGHRNWIAIVDSAYPLQASPGVETVETNTSMVGVLQFVLNAVNNSEHVRPDIFMDAELPFVPDEDAPGAAQYRSNIADHLRAYTVQSLPHDKIIADLNESGRTFQVLILKTNMTIPYSSVFIRLNCKYWSDEAEARLRSKMKAAAGR